MTKIKPVINNILSPIKQEFKKPVTEIIKDKSLKPMLLSASAGAGVIIGSTLSNYKKTSSEENYFQFKINPETGMPFKADIFQEASGMNLYLGNDVLVTAPTGTGKTAIAQYVITKNLKEGNRTFYTTPLKALSNEKFRDFTKTYGEENVGLITGDTKINPNAPIIIMTTEVYRNMAATDKFNFEQNRKGIPTGVKTVIFDELQYLGDIDRGGIWEQSIMFTPRNIQILSLSATVGNNEEINNWIATIRGNKGISVTPQNGYKPHLNETKESVLINVPSENRHVPLNFEIEHAASEIKLPRGGSKAEKTKAKKEGARISQSIFAKPRDDAFKALTRKLNQEGKLPAIYFIFSKKECRHMLKYLSTESEILTTEEEQKEISRIIEQYKSDGIYLGESLNFDALKKGYAIHNAGLLPNQKKLVEELFQKKLVKVVLATETLSAGINMPAKTTVISSPRKPASTSDGGEDKKRNLTANEFHQMAGRAGRRGIDTEGFCYPISCNREQYKFYENIIKSPANDLTSNLELDYSFIANYLSEFKDEDELKYYLSKSLFSYSNGNNSEEILKKFHLKKELLEKEGFIDPDGQLTTKGYLLKLINGYEQIPLINFIANKSLEGLSPRQIAGVIAGLANIDSRTKDDFPEKVFDAKVESDGTFGKIAQKAYQDVKNYEQASSKLYPSRELKINPRTMEHVYEWARLNETRQNSKESWKYLFSGDLRRSIKDEGTLFKEITMTVDLLKQLADIAKEGEALTGDRYYTELVPKLEEALKLIQKDPIEN